MDSPTPRFNEIEDQAVPMIRSIASGTSERRESVCTRLCTPHPRVMSWSVLYIRDRFCSGIRSMIVRANIDSGRLTWLSTEGPTTGVFHATRFSQIETSKPCVVCLPIPSRNTTGPGPRDISRYVRSRAGILSGPLPNRTS
jgi:hypothetical protein